MMWELIKENQRKSWTIFISMGLCLVLLGYLIGTVWFAHQDGGIAGVFLALIVWMIMSLISYFSGDSILLATSRAKEVTYDVHPQLFNIVEEMKIASSLPVMPKIYIIDSPAPNAFATGRSVEKSAIAVTAGLLSSLNRDELQGVIAHEMSHIMNRDVLYMTFAGVLLGSIVLISEIFLRGLFYSGSSRRYRSSSKEGGGQLQLILMVVSVIFAILAPIIARLFYFSLSRKREYLADASAVRLTRYPEGLASALEIISRPAINLESANKVTASMYIVNPFKQKSLKAVSAFSTHPPIGERIKILRSMGQGVNYSHYAQAFSKIKGGSNIMPPSALNDEENIAARTAAVDPQQAKTKKREMRDVGDLMRAVNQYIFLTCACGLKIKLPPNFKKPNIACPRCGRNHEVPLGDVNMAAAMLKTGVSDQVRNQEGQKRPQVTEYQRKNKGWETFACSCGKMVQLSPQFAGNQIQCPGCKTKINIKN